MTTTIDSLKALLEFLRRMKNWDDQLRYDLARAGEDQSWGFINILEGLGTLQDWKFKSKSKGSALNNGASWKPLDGIVLHKTNRTRIHGFWFWADAATDFCKQYYEKIVLLFNNVTQAKNIYKKAIDGDIYKSTVYYLNYTEYFPQMIPFPKNEKFTAQIENYSGVNFINCGIIIYISYAY